MYDGWFKQALNLTRSILVFATFCQPLMGKAAVPSGESQGEIVAKSAEAVRVDTAPRLDGTLDDPLWQSAKPIVDFRQREPYEGSQPTEKTEVRILYTRHAVYFGVHCYDSKPSGIIATELRRDVSQDLDDYFEIMIDSNLDRRSAYVFQINPLGTQIDGLIVEEHGDINTEGDFDPGWDGVWTSEARITSDGWTATVEIPFKTLNFKRSENVAWGLNLKRFIRRKNEQDLWKAYERRYGLTKVSHAGTLNGIHDIGSGRLFIVKPYGLAQYDKQTGQDPRFPLTGGVDIKYGLTSNMVLNLTGNTDFADTDVDLEPFNITPFKVFIPEKRPFFLENAGVFSFTMGEQDQLFFSRNIGIDPVTGQQVPINGGAKQRTMARKPGGDPAATDSTRVLRLPGFINRKYEVEFRVQAEKHTDRIYHLPDFRLRIESIDNDFRMPLRPANTGSPAPRPLSQSEYDWAYAKRALVRGDDPDEIVRRIAQFRSSEKSDPVYYAQLTVSKAQEDLAARGRGPREPAATSERRDVSRDST